jgi:hypothetical protein
MPEPSTLLANIPGFVKDGECYTLDELQSRLQLGRAAWRTARQHGLPVRLVGRRKLVLGRDVLAWLESQPLDIAA